MVCLFTIQINPIRCINGNLVSKKFDPKLNITAYIIHFNLYLRYKNVTILNNNVSLRR